MSFAVIRDNAKPDNVKIFAKGAPDFLLKFCTKYLFLDGKTDELDEKEREGIVNHVIKMNFAKKSYRTILTAYKEMPLKEFNEILKDPKNK